MGEMGKFPAERFVAANGLSLRCLDWGAEDGANGEVLLLLHGLRDGAREWDAIAPALRRHGRVLALDQRGHGESDRPATGYAPEDYADDLAAVCDALGLDRAVPIGHSLGGRVALTFAARFPERVARLALIDIGAAGRPGTVAAAVAALEAGYGPFPDEGAALQALVGARFAPNAATRAYVRHNLRRLPDGRLGWRYDLRAAIETIRLGRDRDYWNELERIDAPTLLIRGERSDVLARGEAERMASTLRRGALVEIPGVGHLIPQLRPDALAAALTAWLEGP